MLRVATSAFSRISVVSRGVRAWSASSGKIVVESPYSGETVAEIPLISEASAMKQVDAAAAAQAAWAQSDLSHRIAVCEAFLNNVEANKNRIAEEISLQMGKPISQAFNEINGMKDRTRALIDMAPRALAEETFPDSNGIRKKIVKEPVGVVFSIAPWNYPLLTSVNSVIPAVLAGNSVILKMSPRTPLTAVSAFANAFASTDAPYGLVTAMDSSNETSAAVIGNPKVGFVSFTGSVASGRVVYQTVASRRFIDVTLELGGKDPAYLCEDADFDAAVATIVDGACYNAGQSCCAIERVYVHKSLYKKFIDAAAAEMKAYKLGNPLDTATSLGPMALASAVPFLKAQVDEAVSKGAKVIVGGDAHFDGVSRKARFFAPTLLADTDQSMNVVMEESFGPILPVQAVESDEHAVQLMNESQYGLTAAVFTKNLDRFDQIASKMQCGTVYMNRCDYLDPYLPWSGVKNTGKGVSLSTHGFRGVTRLKGYNMRLPK